MGQLARGYFLLILSAWLLAWWVEMWMGSWWCCLEGYLLEEGGYLGFHGLEISGGRCSSLDTTLHSAVFGCFNWREAVPW